MTVIRPGNCLVNVFLQKLLVNRSVKLSDVTWGQKESRCRRSFFKDLSEEGCLRCTYKSSGAKRPSDFERLNTFTKCQATIINCWFCVIWGKTLNCLCLKRENKQQQDCWKYVKKQPVSILVTLPHTPHTHTHTHTHRSYTSPETALMGGVSRLSGSFTKSQNRFFCLKPSRNVYEWIHHNGDRSSFRVVSQTLNNTMRPNCPAVGSSCEEEHEECLHQRSVSCLSDSQSISVSSLSAIWYPPSAHLAQKANAIWWQVEQGGETTAHNKGVRWIKHDVTREKNTTTHSLRCIFISAAVVDTQTRPSFFSFDFTCETFAFNYLLGCIFIRLQTL